MKKYFAIFAVALLALVGCDKNNDEPKPGDLSALNGQWHLVEWNGEAPEKFDVYVKYKSGKFDIYEQTHSLYYVHSEGTYTINGDIATGIYSTGENWACGYKFSVSGDTLTMYSQEDISITSVYEKCEIPQSIIDEATTTRASEVKPFL